MLLLNTIQSSIRCFRYSNTLRSTNVDSVVQVQRYCKWMHRNPVTILNEDEISAVDNEEVVSNEIAQPSRPLRRRRNRKKRATKRVEDESLDFEGASSQKTILPVFTKLWDNTKVISKLMAKIRSHKERERNKKILLEGHRLITDAIIAGANLESLIFSKNPDLEKLPLPKSGVTLYKVPYRSIQLWSTLTTAPGIMGIFKMPDVRNVQLSSETIPLTIICDNIREPGNLGSILRVAAGIGCKRVILMRGCVDLWESKVLRSAAGAHFRLSIYGHQLWSDVQSLINDNADVFIADSNVYVSSESNNSVTELEDVESVEESVVSANDLDDERNDEDKKLSGSIELKDRNANGRKMRNWRKMEKSTLKGLISGISTVPYYSVNYTRNEIVLIVGGESEGLSRESLTLVKDRHGARVNVPLINGVDSLNVGVALGIIASEVKRQLITGRNTDEE